MQPPVDRSVSPLLSRARPGTNSKKEAPESAESGLLGVWKGGQFEFSSPLAEARWEREAYRQAVNSQTWHKGRVVDSDTKALIDAKVAGPSHAIYQGPDGEHRFFDPGVAETADVRAIRMRNFTGKTWAELNASKMPGEDEAAAHHAARRAVNEARGGKPSDASGSATNTTGAAITAPVRSANEFSDTNGLSGQSRVLAEAKTPRSDAFFPSRATIAGALPSGPLLAADLSGIPNGGGAAALLRLASPPTVAPATMPVAPALRILGPAARQLAITGEGMAVEGSKPLPDRAGNPVAAAIDATVDPAFLAATQGLLNNPDYADPEALAEKLSEIVEWVQRDAIDSYRYQPGVDTYRPVNAVEIDLIKRALQERVLDILPADRRGQVGQLWSEQPLTIQDGPTGLVTMIEALQRSNGVEVYFGDDLVISTKGGAVEMLGSPEIQLLNKITKEEVEAFLKACQGFSNVEHTGGTVDKDGERVTESWIQDIVNRLTTKGSRFMDVTFKVEINGQQCSFHINTADITRSGLLTKKEWVAINDAATTMQRNGANQDAVLKFWKGRIQSGVISKLNAFLAIPKPPIGSRTEDEMRKAVQDFLKLLSCADIEAACKDNAVINPSRNSKMVQ